jgi:stage V sporulation protein G
MKWEITIEKFYPFPLKGKNANVLAYADVKIDNLLLIRGIKLLQKPNGAIFIGLPSIPVREGEHVPVVEILDRNLREAIRKTLSDYWKENFK